MSEQSLNQSLEDEISLKDVINFLSESWKVIALGGIIGALLATGYAFITPPKHQATVNIQVAKVAGTDVETPTVLVEKLKMPMYYSIESHSACNVMDKDDPGKEIAKNIKPTLSKSSAIISFSYKNSSRENVQNCIESILTDIRKNQSLLAQPILQTKKNQLMGLKQKLAIAERVVKVLPNKNLSFDFSDSKFSAFALLLATSLSKENEISDLAGQISDLEIQLSEWQTRETSLVTQIYIPKQKVLATFIIFLTVGLVAGSFFGLLLMIGKRSWHVNKKSTT